MAILAILAVVIAAAYFYSLYHVPPALDFNALSLTGMDGKQVELAKLKGKKLFINFFDTSDDSCLQRIPLIEKAQAAMGKDNSVFLCISDEPVARLDSLRQKIGSNLLFLHSTKKLSDLKILNLPTTYILDPKGEMIYKKAGPSDWSSKETLGELNGAE